MKLSEFFECFGFVVFCIICILLICVGLDAMFGELPDSMKPVYDYAAELHAKYPNDGIAIEFDGTMVHVTTRPANAR